MNALRSEPLVLVELNEVNFDIAAQYVAAGDLPAFGKLLAGSSVRTSAEEKYEELEPWIQWPSIHSGLTRHEHGVFRLGDMVGTPVPQMFEQLEQRGVSVGCVSPMNTENRLQNPAYFLPDPWTKTPSDGSWWSRALTEAVSQVVNDNAQARVGIKSAVSLALGLLRFARPRHYGLYLNLIARSRGAPWRKALVLDLLLHDLHMRLFAKHRPAFSTLFLNAGAHIQHHYFFNAAPIKAQSTLRNPSWYVSDDADPVAEMLQVYDRILGDYLHLPGVSLLIATGLSQQPYDRVKFYYRLKDHASFLQLLDIPFRAVLPRMTRDFLVEFASAEQALAAQQRLEQVRIAGTGQALFGDIDNRGDSLFVTLTYPSEIDESVMFEVNGRSHPLAPHVAFVAIKNGMHQSKGFAFFTPGLAPYAPADGQHVKELYSTVMNFFGADQSSTAARPRP